MRAAVLALVVLAGCTPSASANTDPARDAGVAVHAFASSVDMTDAGAVAHAEAPREDEALPPAASEELNARARHLIEAIVQDNPALSADILLPREAFASARDAADPARAWEKTVNVPFTRAVHTLSKRARGLEKAQVVTIELGHSIAQVTPKKKDWKRPLWKVRHSRITVGLDGRTQRIDVAEMMAWRGAWYVTKLR